MTRGMVLLLDNYDSFVFNLARYLVELGVETRVIRSDAITVEELRRLAPRAIVISPGPRTPKEAGVSLDVVREFGPSIPTLGVCLGHQVIGEAFGGNVDRSPEPRHGRTSLVRHDGTDLFEGLPDPLRAMRYHSLVVRDDENLPKDLRVTARTESGLVMGLSHRRWPVHGVQFHPESILTDQGHRLLANFLRLAGLPVSDFESGERESVKAVEDFFLLPIEDGTPPLPPSP